MLLDDVWVVVEGGEERIWLCGGKFSGFHM
jgi:hypothetical protein